MRCHLIPAPHGTNRDGDHFQALVYGPVVLARDENTDPQFMQPVSITANEAQEIAIQPTKPTLPGTRMEFIVPTADGPIHMVDYASVNGWEGKRVCTWLPMKE